MDTFDDVFAKFGGPTKFAEAIGIDPIHAGTMKSRGSIPPGYWSDIVSAAKQRDLHEITLSALAGLAKAKRATPTPERAAS